MPIKINVCLSKKIGETNFGSRGGHVGLEVETDASLLSNPDLLRQKIHQLFGMVRQSLDEELATKTWGRQKAAPTTPTENQPQNGAHPPSATKNQVRALLAISKSRNLDLKQLLNERFGVHRADDLNIKQASDLIDELNNNGRDPSERR